MKSLVRAAKYLAIGIGALISTPFSFSGDITLPIEWRLPADSEVSDDWRQKGSEKYAVIRGDFNGDGIVDTAMLLVSLQDRGVGLFVFLSQNDKSFKVYKLNEEGSIGTLGIDKVLPGKYKTACGKGYGCKGNEGRDELLIKHDAIEYFRVKGESSYFYWDERAEIFRSTLIITFHEQLAPFYLMIDQSFWIVFCVVLLYLYDHLFMRLKDESGFSKIQKIIRGLNTTYRLWLLALAFFLWGKAMSNFWG